MANYSTAYPRRPALSGAAAAVHTAPLPGLVCDNGSRVAQTIAQTTPDRVRALVLSPPLPGAGDRVLSPTAEQEFWYQAFHQLDLAADLIDGSAAAVRAYLEHFWSHWSGPEYRQPDGDLEQLVEFYAAPGAFTASIGWYRAGSGTVVRSLAEVPPGAGKRIAVPTTILWPEHDPLFPLAWSDRIDEFFTAATVRPVRESDISFPPKHRRTSHRRCWKRSTRRVATESPGDARGAFCVRRF